MDGGGGGGGFGGGFGGGGGSGSFTGGGGAGLGGGIFTMFGSLTLINSTLSGNTAGGGDGAGTGAVGGSGYGGAIFNLNGTTTLIHATIANNSVSSGTSGGSSSGNGNANAGGVYNFAFGNTLTGGAQTATVTLTNSILANSTGGLDLVNNVNPNLNPPNVNTATVTLNGPNLVTSSTGNLSGTTPLTANPQLGPLQNNGGDTETLAIPTTSPAFAAGDPSLLSTGVTTDQRGFTRVVNSQLDLGAFQIQAAEVNVSPLSAFFRFADQRVNLSAKVTAPGFSSVNEGDVTFTVLGQTLPPVNVVNGVASTTLRIPGGTPHGTYAITAVYDPLDLRGSTIGDTLIVDPAPTSVSSVSNVTLPFTNVDPAVTLSASVATPEGAVNIGQVRFVVTTKPSGSQVGQAVTANVHNGQASKVFDVPADTPVGAYTITANYSGPAGNFLSSSNTGTLNVVTSPTTVAVNNVNIVYGLFSEQETLMAVVFNALGQVVNQGFVTFSDSGQTVTVPVVNSLATATLNIPVFSENPFAHSITAAYNSNTGDFFASTTQFTIEQTLIDFLLQIMALELFLQSASNNR